ncbi:MAG: hypothetical protein LBT99_03145 [Bifidobacteriaceae bacterium]|nr:hypothetical protein [Bifidobacteriaceae bacterium]
MELADWERRGQAAVENDFKIVNGGQRDPNAETVIDTVFSVERGKLQREAVELQKIIVQKYS